jgi:hypothetical protein
MTTSNRIITSLKDKALFIPLECLHNHLDSITYVFKREGLNIIKQEVMIGETNANDAVILAGLSQGDRVYLSLPAGQGDKEIQLMPEMDGKRKKKEEEQPEVAPSPGPNEIVRPTARKTGNTRPDKTGGCKQYRCQTGH